MSENWSEFYKKVYEEGDNPETPSHGWIQWKGTSVCIDLHCECGSHYHYDGDFFYYYRCKDCKRVYAVGQNIKLIPLTEELIKLGEIEERIDEGF